MDSTPKGTFPLYLLNFPLIFLFQFHLVTNSPPIRQNICNARDIADVLEEDQKNSYSVGILAILPISWNYSVSCQGIVILYLANHPEEEYKAKYVLRKSFNSD